jgi:hypothetical protein
MKIKSRWKLKPPWKRPMVGRRGDTCVALERPTFYIQRSTEILVPSIR